MKVAILGPPAAEKTKIGRRLARRLTQAGGKRWTLIDGYVETLAEKTGKPYGGASDWSDNLEVIATRWILEAEAASVDRHTITCGSIYESLIYSSARGTFNPANERQMLVERQLNMLMMQALGALETMTFDYHALFWLPWSDDHPEEWDHTWGGVVNAKLPEVLEGFGKYAVPLVGTDREKVDRAEDIITRILVATTAPDDESGV